MIIVGSVFATNPAALTQNREFLEKSSKLRVVVSTSGIPVNKNMAISAFGLQSKKSSPKLLESGFVKKFLAFRKKGIFEVVDQVFGLTLSNIIKLKVFYGGKTLTVRTSGFNTKVGIFIPELKLSRNSYNFRVNLILK